MCLYLNNLDTGKTTLSVGNFKHISIKTYIVIYISIDHNCKVLVILHGFNVKVILLTLPDLYHLVLSLLLQKNGKKN